MAVRLSALRARYVVVLEINISTFLTSAINGDLHATATSTPRRKRRDFIFRGIEDLMNHRTSLGVTTDRKILINMDIR
jgi:hypothetical protein